MNVTRRPRRGFNKMQGSINGFVIITFPSNGRGDVTIGWGGGGVLLVLGV